MTTRPDILFVIGTLQVGGSELHLRQIASALIRRGWSVALCSLSGDGPLRKDLEASGVVIHLPPVDRDANMNTAVRFAKLAIVAIYLFGLFLWRRPKIVHFFLPRAYLMGAPLAVLAWLPVRVVSRRSLNVYQQAHPILRGAEHLCHKVMTAVLGNSMSVVSELREEGVPEDRLGLIYNGIDLTRFENLPERAAVRRSLGIGTDTVVFCIVANLIPYKGHLDLLDALALAAAEIPGWHLLIVGRDDGVGESLRRHAAEVGIDARISFLGSRADVPALFAASDIGLSCSHEEGFSNAVLEAMACGLPTIVTRVGGNQEAVIDGKTGLIVPPHDPDSLASAIKRLANDAHLCVTLGQAGRERVTEAFSFERCVERYDALYHGLLAGRQSADVLGN